VCAAETTAFASATLVLHARHRTSVVENSAAASPRRPTIPSNSFNPFKPNHVNTTSAIRELNAGMIGRNALALGSGYIWYAGL